MACSEADSRSEVYSGSGDRRDGGSGSAGGEISMSSRGGLCSSLAGKSIARGCCEGLLLVLCETLTSVECIDIPNVPGSKVGRG